jgi:hypothetical protein
MEGTSIFVSSTFADLKDFRSAVRSTVRRSGLMDIAMENFGSRDDRPFDECLRLIRTETDVFVGIYAHRYGFVPRGKAESITVGEYRGALGAGIPILAYLVDEGAKWPGRNIEKGTAAVRLRKFKEALRQRHIVSFFSAKEELAAMVAADLGRLLRQNRTRAAALRKLSDESLEREQRLLANLQTRDPSERERAVSALSSLGSAAAVPTLVRLMLGPDSDLAYSAARALEWGSAIANGLLSPHPKVRHWAVFRIGENALRDQAWGLRQVPALTKLLETRAEEIRVLKEVAHSLSKIGGRPAMNALLRVLRGRGTPPLVAVTALHGPLRFWKDPMFASAASNQLIPEFTKKVRACIDDWSSNYCAQLVRQDLFEELDSSFREHILTKLPKTSRPETGRPRAPVTPARPLERPSPSAAVERKSAKAVALMKQSLLPHLSAVAAYVDFEKPIEIVISTEHRRGRVEEASFGVTMREGVARLTQEPPRYIDATIRAKLEDWPRLLQRGIDWKDRESGLIELFGDVAAFSKFVEAWNKVLSKRG